MPLIDDSNINYGTLDKGLEMGKTGKSRYKKSKSAAGGGSIKEIMRRKSYKKEYSKQLEINQKDM
jgi:hypothetical protein